MVGAGGAESLALQARQRRQEIQRAVGPGDVALGGILGQVDADLAVVQVGYRHDDYLGQAAGFLDKGPFVDPRGLGVEIHRRVVLARGGALDAAHLGQRIVKNAHIVDYQQHLLALHRQALADLAGRLRRDQGADGRICSAVQDEHRAPDAGTDTLEIQDRVPGQAQRAEYDRERLEGVLPVAAITRPHQGARNRVVQAFLRAFHPQDLDALGDGFLGVQGRETGLDKPLGEGAAGGVENAAVHRQGLADHLGATIQGPPQRIQGAADNAVPVIVEAEHAVGEAHLGVATEIEGRAQVLHRGLAAYGGDNAHAAPGELRFRADLQAGYRAEGDQRQGNAVRFKLQHVLVSRPRFCPRR